MNPVRSKISEKPANSQLTNRTSSGMKNSVLFRAYAAGFTLSILLTLTSFAIVGDKILGGWGLTLVLVGFATIQLIVQLLFFLHIDREASPRWNLQVFGFMAVVLLILVLGSLWIMNNLKYPEMTPEETDKFLLEEEAIDR